MIVEDYNWWADEPREKWTHCRRGHPYNERNTQYKNSKKADGVVYRVRACRRCKALADARYRARQRRGHVQSSVQNTLEARV